MRANAAWRRLAEEDLTATYLHIGSDSANAAEHLLDAVADAVLFLLEHPGAGRNCGFRSPHAEGIRSWPVRGFERYLIFYQRIDHGVEVVRFLHGARDVARLFGDEC